MNQVVAKKQLIDSHGRRIRKLRVSLLDACNFRCFYCMPLDAKFMKQDKYLSPAEIESICLKLSEYGLEQIRVTGGEPLLRKEFRDIMSRLSALPIDKIGMTTNGYKLDQELDFLQSTRCRHINISLDSLSKENFNKITRKDVFDNVYSSILQAKKMGFNVKINTVLMKGVNDHEIFDFMDFSAANDIEVRFLEVMKIGQACGAQDNLFMSAGDAILKMKEKEGLDIVEVESDSTSFNFRTESGAQIGFIASESMPFCGSCSRWRLSADGFLRACLMSNKGVKIKGADDSSYDELLHSLLPMKPTGRIDHIKQDMNQIGG